MQQSQVTKCPVRYADGYCENPWLEDVAMFFGGGMGKMLHDKKAQAKKNKRPVQRAGKA